MPNYSEEVKQLAETLKSSGLAASMVDALERAQRMVGKDEEPKEVIKEPKEEVLVPKDPAQTTLGNVDEKITIEESPEEETELKKEEVFAEKEEPEQEKKTEEKKLDPKTYDLNEIFNVNK